jgi:purine-binding chemotaxis protein CheW
MERASEQPTTRWVGFRLGAQQYALPIQQVREVLPSIVIEPVPGAESVIRGVMNLRGRIVTVVDLHLRLGVPGADPHRTYAVIAEVDGEPVALSVDCVTELHKIMDVQIKSPPALAPGRPDLAVQGVYNRNGTLVTLLDACGVVRPLERS